MVADLVEDLLRCPEVGRIIVTQNVAEDVRYPDDARVFVIRNQGPGGYGANHNAAFARTAAPFFCVLNPDIRLQGNPFPSLLEALSGEGVALVAPKIVSPGGAVEDSARRFPTFRGLVLKALGRDDGTYTDSPEMFFPDWVAGMFLLLESSVFGSIGGFDENFYLYYEDVDLCARLRMRGHRVCRHGGVGVIHDARRESRRSLRFAFLHLASMMRYLRKYRAL